MLVNCVIFSVIVILIGIYIYFVIKRASEIRYKADWLVITKEHGFGDIRLFDSWEYVLLRMNQRGLISSDEVETYTQKLKSTTAKVSIYSSFCNLIGLEYLNVTIVGGRARHIGLGLRANSIKEMKALEKAVVKKYTKEWGSPYLFTDIYMWDYFEGACISLYKKSHLILISAPGYAINPLRKSPLAL